MVQTAAYEDIQSLDMTPDGRYIAFVADIGAFSNSLNAVEIWDGQAASLVSASLDVNGQAPTNSLCDWPTLDPSGRLVTFLSTAANLVTNATPGDYHLYLRDLHAGTTTLLDADTNGAGSTLGPAAVPSVSADATLVAFACPGSSLVPNDGNRASDVFVREPGPGVTDLISAHDPALVSTTPNGPSALGASPVNADGTILAFESEANNVVANDTNRMRDVFVRDLTRQTNLLVSVNTNGFSGDGLSSDPSVSSDGRYVAFASYADDLVPNDSNQARDVFIRDLRVGTTTLISVNASGTGPGSGDSYGPLMSTNGRYVLFHSRAQNLGPTNNSGEILILRDWQAGTNYLVSASAVQMCAMTPDASRIVYVISLQAYVWDFQAGSTIYTRGAPPGGWPTCVAISADGSTIALGTPGGLGVANANTSTSTNLDSGIPPGGLYAAVQLSGDGRLLAASKSASTTLPKQIYLYDVLSAQPLLLSHSWNSTSPASADSDSPQFSPDGRFVAYQSRAADLLPGAGNGYSQVFLFDRETGTTSLLSVSGSSGDFGSGSSTHPVFSADGQTIWFQSAASDLVARDFNESGDLFAFTLIRASILPRLSPGEGPWLSWRYFPGQQYRVQFKDDLGATSWQDSTGTVTNDGLTAFFQDPAPGSVQRFYRVVGF